jgi:uncharacterized FlgJ-related protein
MSLDTRFTEEELFLLANTPFSIGQTMAFAAGSGLATVKELFASTKSFIDGAKNYPKNEIIAGILPNLSNGKEAKAEAKAFQEKAKENFKAKDIKKVEDMRQYVIDDANAVATLLEEKATPEEIKEYKEWTMSIAENVAKAAKEGGFLGFGGELVSQEEKDLYTAIASALGTDADLS